MVLLNRSPDAADKTGLLVGATGYASAVLSQRLIPGEGSCNHHGQFVPFDGVCRVASAMALAKPVAPGASWAGDKCSIPIPIMAGIDSWVIRTVKIAAKCPPFQRAVSPLGGRHRLRVQSDCPDRDRRRDTRPKRSQGRRREETRGPSARTVAHGHVHDHASNRGSFHPVR